MTRVNEAGRWAAGLTALLLMGGATSAYAKDDRDARIAALEAEVHDLVAEVHDLKAATASQLQDVQASQSSTDAQVADLKASQVIQLQDVRATQAAAPTVSLSNGRPTFSTADGKFTASIRAVSQLDVAHYSQSSAGPITRDLRRSGPALGANVGNADLSRARSLKDGDLFRRARLGVDGTAFGDWDYRILLDFGGSGVENTGQVYETWVQYSGLKPFKFKVGAFAPLLGLDDAASTSSMPFLERASVTDIARGLAAGDTRTAAQIFAGGDHWLAAAAVTGRTVGVANTGTVVTFTSAGTPAAPVTAAIATAQSYDDQLGFTARFAATPIHGSDYLVHLGVNGSYVERPPNVAGPSAATGGVPLNGYVVSLSNTPEVRVDGTRLINTGSVNARHADTLGVELAAQRRNLLLQSEYQRFDIDRSDGISSPHFSGYYVSGAWILTGETRKYNGQTGAFDAVVPAQPFSLKTGGRGAWELALRYSDVDLNYHEGAAGTAPGLDSIRGGEEKNWSFGINWYPNSVVRFMVDYANVRVDRLSPSAVVYQTPVGAQIGQRFDVLSGRAQFAF